MVMSFLGLNGRNQHSGLLTRQCEELLSHLFSALCLLSLPLLSNAFFLSKRVLPIMFLSLFSIGSGRCVINFFPVLLNHHSSSFLHRLNKEANLVCE